MSRNNSYRTSLRNMRSGNGTFLDALTIDIGNGVKNKYTGGDKGSNAEKVYDFQPSGGYVSIKDARKKSGGMATRIGSYLPEDSSYDYSLGPLRTVANFFGGHGMESRSFVTLGNNSINIDYNRVNPSLYKTRPQMGALEEIGHMYQNGEANSYKNTFAGKFYPSDWEGSVKVGKNGKVTAYDLYQTPGTYEFDAHSVIMPALVHSADNNYTKAQADKLVALGRSAAEKLARTNGLISVNPFIYSGADSQDTGVKGALWTGLKTAANIPVTGVRGLLTGDYGHFITDAVHGGLTGMGQAGRLLGILPKTDYSLELSGGNEFSRDRVAEKINKGMDAVAPFIPGMAVARHVVPHVATTATRVMGNVGSYLKDGVSNIFSPISSVVASNKKGSKPTLAGTATKAAAKAGARAGATAGAGLATGAGSFLSKLFTPVSTTVNTAVLTAKMQKQKTKKKVSRQLGGTITYFK